ncbi:MAG: LytTR family DNA-binding domain-containing protein [Clostridiales Family XIII bacterium]|nr:LytTR family DNA-binding domain-containing protein [Clostridiales Family XIII bacterium]
MNVLIVEDNFEDMEYCAALIKELDTNANVLKAGTGKKAVDMLLKYDIDVAFIDVGLPDFSGFRLVSELRKMEKYLLLKLVFITAEEADQLEVYKQFHCYDYITKPFSQEIFFGIAGPLLKGIKANQQEASEKRRRDVAVLEGKDETYLIEKEQILFVESFGRTVKLQLEKKVISDIRVKLEDLIAYIDQPYFVRCHKSFAVNLMNVSRIEAGKNSTWDMEFHNNPDVQCPIGRTYYKSIKRKLQELGNRNNG